MYLSIHQDELKVIKFWAAWVACPFQEHSVLSFDSRRYRSEEHAAFTE